MNSLPVPAGSATLPHRVHYPSLPCNESGYVHDLNLTDLRFHTGFGRNENHRFTLIREATMGHFVNAHTHTQFQNLAFGRPCFKQKLKRKENMGLFLNNFILT